LLGNPIPEERTFVEWRHQQRIGDSVSLNALFNYWQDSEITRDFRPKSFHAVQQPDSFFEASRSGGNSVLSLFTRFHPNRYHRVQQRLPEFRFDLLPTPAPLGLYHRFESSVAFLEEESFLEERRQRTGRFDAYYGLFRPVAPFPWLAVTPVAGGRVTHYTNAAGGRKNHRREIGEVGFDARLLASGTFGYRNELWEIDGLRHLLMPALSYRYAPQASDGQAFIPSIDRRVFATHLQPLSIADSRNIDDLERLDTLRLQFGNTLQTRNDGGGSRDLAAFNIAADYWFTRPRSGNGRKGLSDVYSELSLTPAPWLRLAVFQRTDVHTGIQRELNTSLELIDREWWSVRLATYFLKNDYEEYSLDYQIRLNENWDAAARWRYDSRRNRMNEQTYGLWQRLGQTWTVKYEVSFFEGPRRESSFAFNLEVDLLKF
jgi:LPS-assembly protein